MCYVVMFLYVALVANGVLKTAVQLATRKSDECILPI